MNRRLKVFTAALVVTGLLAVAFGGFALADTPATTNTTGTACPMGQLGWGGHGMGSQMGQGIICDEIVSDLLGLSAEDIQAQRLEGKSLVEIAAAQGVSEDTLVAAILEAKTAHIQELVASGTLTAEQAEFMLQNMEQNITRMVNQTGTGPFGGGHGHGQSGMGMHRWAQTS